MKDAAPYYGNILEEELKNKVGKEWFARYDTTQIIGKIDFCVAVPIGEGPELFETESLLWAEAKSGTRKDLYESFVQLILTIGRARTFDNHLPPAFLGAFDAEKIGLLPYNTILDVFYQNDFNWNVTPSDHTTKEFRQIYSLVSDTLKGGAVIYRFADDKKELQHFIKNNFIVGKSRQTKIRINKNNFTSIYHKWSQCVKPTIAVDWNLVRQSGIIDADFYLADILSKENGTLRDNLFVLLNNDHYILDRHINTQTGLFSSSEATFSDGQKAHREFWMRYNRPPKREYWDYIVERRDLLVPQDVRERKGSYFTPQQWVELSQQYLAAELGEDWQEEYTIWDCAAGTGNLLAGLTNKYNIWASTLDKADVDVMHDRIHNGANLLENHVFQFDFLNDSFDRLPEGLRAIVNDPERRKKLVIYINPPYAEAANKSTVTGEGENKTNVSVKHLTYSKYFDKIGIAGRELFAQFFIRIYCELHNAVLAEFSTLKILQAPNFQQFREIFRAKLGRFFLVPADTFDNVKGQFPIGFFIWHTAINEKYQEATSYIYDKSQTLIGKKNIVLIDNYPTINDWIIKTRNRTNEEVIGYMSAKGCDFQNANYNYIINDKSQLPHPRGTVITDKNLIEIGIYFACRHCISADWLNDRDQFLFPNDGWKDDKQFKVSSLIFTIFSTNIKSGISTNHWIPFTEAEVEAKDNFESHFMSDFLRGKRKSSQAGSQQDLFGTPTEDNFIPLEHLSEAAHNVMDCGRALWRYYHSQPDANPNASLYDIRLYFQGTKTTEKGKTQMNSDSADETYTELISSLRQSLKQLAAEIRPKVYEYGFLKK